MIENKKLKMSVKKEGYVSELIIKDDPYKMNWVIEDTYLQQAGYQDMDKLFGLFDITADGEKTGSEAVNPVIKEEQSKIEIGYDFEKFKVKIIYDLSVDAEALFWKIELENNIQKKIQITDFGIWVSFAYVMFRDKNVLRNIHNSAAVFPSISTDYTKLSMVRRDGTGTNLGLYQVKGKTKSVGTYCDYENLFFENVSPSLDGMLFHKLYLAGGYPQDFKNNDWIYEKDGFILEAGETKTWEYVISVNQGENDFYQEGLKWKHPRVEYTPLNIIGEGTRVSVEVPEGLEIASAEAHYKEDNLIKKLSIPVCKDPAVCKESAVCKELAVYEEKAICEDTKICTDTKRCKNTENCKVSVKTEKYNLIFKPAAMGEHKVVIRFTDNTEDFVVLNVMDKIDKVIEERVEYICDSLYHNENENPPYAFEPVSNQGESLGKANLVLQKNIFGKLDASQVQKVEKCAVNYVRPKWFIDGDFRKPRKLYGDFYRCMDFEYIAHLFYLLSEFDDSALALNTADTYLEWAADVFELRVNPDLHEEECGKEEAQMLGVYFLYFKRLFDKLKAKGMTEKYNKIQSLWEKVMDRVAAETETYKAAITEHFYDNAGFGPTAGALCESGRGESAEKYGDLGKISKLVGFNSEIYFSNCFKKYMEISPKNYRKKYENKI